MRSSYYKIQLRLEDVENISFRTQGHDEFKVMPLKLTNGPTTFQVTMNELFHPYLWKFLFIFFDDILICKKNLKGTPYVLGGCTFLTRKKSGSMKKYQRVLLVKRKLNTSAISYPRKESR